MNIFILEDDFIQQTRMENLVYDILEKNCWEVKHCGVYGKPNQLLEDMMERGGHQLFFLDIEIKNDVRKGLDIALEIRDRDPNAVIVFVTTHSEFMPVSFQYQVSALDFIDKELPESAFRERVTEDSFVFTNSKALVQVPFSDLLYIETSMIPHKLVLYTMRERIEFYGKISDILKQEPRLVQCHRSFIVNPYNISSIDKEEKLVYLKNGSSCLVSRLKMRALLNIVKDLHDSKE